MNKIIAIVLLTLIMFAPVASPANTLYVNTTGWYINVSDFNTTATPIQHAVDNASSYDTIYIWNGSYTENINVGTAHITIQGESRTVTNVTASSASDHVFEVTANYTNITAMNITGATDTDKAGIYLYTNTNNCNVSYTNTTDNYHGILLHSSNNSTIIENNISSNKNGIYTESSDNATLTNNTANSNTIRGIFLWFSDNNTLTSNTANSNLDGITLSTSDSNTLTTNNATSNTNYGTYLERGTNNDFHQHVSASSGLYDYFARAFSANNVLYNCELSSTTSMMNDSVSHWLVVHSTYNNITDFSDTTLNQTVSPTNVTTDINSATADYSVSMTTLSTLNMSSGVDTVNVRLVSYASGGHTDVIATSSNSSEVLTINIGAYVAGEAVQLRANNIRTHMTHANANGVATFVYGSGFSEVDFDIDQSLNVTLNDTTNYTYTVDSYNASAFTSTINLTWNGNGNGCTASIEMPLITTSGYTGISYDASNTSTSLKVSNISSKAFCNFTLSPSSAGSTYVNIAPSTKEQTTDLPASVVAAVSAGTIITIIYLYRRRRS